MDEQNLEAYAVPNSIHRKIHDLEFTTFTVKDSNPVDWVKAKGYFNLAHRMLQPFDQLEVCVDNDEEKVFLKFLVKAVDIEEKTVDVMLLEEYDLLEEDSDEVEE